MQFHHEANLNGNSSVVALEHARVLKPSATALDIIAKLQTYAVGMERTMASNPASWTICGAATKIVHRLIDQDYKSNPNIQYCDLDTTVSLVPGNEAAIRNFHTINDLETSALIKAVVGSGMPPDEINSAIEICQINRGDSPFWQYMRGEMPRNEACVKLSERSGYRQVVFDNLDQIVKDAIKENKLDLAEVGKFKGVYGHSCALIRLTDSHELIFADYSPRQFDMYLPENQRQKFPLVVQLMHPSLIRKASAETVAFIPDQPKGEYLLAYRIRNRSFTFGSVTQNSIFDQISERIRSNT